MRRVLAIAAVALLGSHALAGDLISLLAAKHRAAGAAQGGQYGVPYLVADPDGVASSCVFWFSLDNDENPQPDMTGNGNDATSQGATHIISGDDAYLDFNGTSGVLTNDPSLFTFAVNEGWTVGGWVNIDAVDSNHEVVFTADKAGAGTVVLLRWRSGVGWDFTVRDENNVVANAVWSGATSPTGTWHHVVGVYEPTGEDLFLYVDGVLRGSSTSQNYSGGWGGCNELGFAGNTANSYWLNGKLDDGFMFSTALTGNQVATMYGYGPYN